MKRCKICELEKELSEFAIIRPKKSGGFTYSSRCKKCHSRLAYEAIKRDPGKLEARKKNHDEWLKKNKEHRKEYERKYAKEYWQKKKDEGVKSPSRPRRRSKEEQSLLYQGRKEYSRNAWRLRQLRKKGVGGAHTVGEWEALKAHYDHKCLCCGKQEPEIELTRDHVIAITKGGTDDIENIQPLCRGCNAAKQANEIDFRN